MAAIRLMANLVELSGQLARGADPASPFTPKGASLTVGQITGGTAVNILARECVFLFDVRTPPGLDPDQLLEPFYGLAASVDEDLKARAPEAGVVVQRRSKTSGWPAPWPATTARRGWSPTPPRPANSRAPVSPP